MKKIFAGFIFLVLAGAPVLQAKDATETFMDSLFEAYNEDRFDDMKAFFQERARIYFMGERKDKPQTVEALINRWQGEGQAIAERRMGVKRIIPFERGMIVQYVFYGLPAQNGVAGTTLSGREGIVFLEFEDNKIQEWREYTNPMLVQQLIGPSMPRSKIPDWPVAAEMVFDDQVAATKEVALGFYKALNDGNNEAAAALLSENGTFYNHTISSQEPLGQVVDARMQNIFEQFKNRRIVIEDMHIAGPYAVLRIFNYTDKLAVPSCDVVKVHDGKIEAVEEYFNISEFHAMPREVV